MARYTMLSGRTDPCVRVNNRRSSVPYTAVTTQWSLPAQLHENWKNVPGDKFSPLLGRKFLRQRVEKWNNRQPLRPFNP